MNNLTVLEYRSERVLTTQQLAEAYGTDPKTISYNFNYNKDKYTEGKHYILLQGDALKAFREIHDLPPSINKLYLWTEKGTLLHAKSLNTDVAWEIYDRLVESYFRVRQIANDDLSPNLQLMKSLVAEMERKELADKERDRKIAETQAIAKKSIESVEAIKEAVTPILDDWRAEISKRIRRVQKMSNIDFQTLNAQMYSTLEHRAGCDLGTRLRNKRSRMQNDGRTKTDINNTRKIDIIEEDKKLREIFAGIVKEYEVKYCA